MKKILYVVLLFATCSAVAQVATPAALKTALSNATQAAIISLSGVNPISCPEVSMSQTWDGEIVFFRLAGKSDDARNALQGHEFARDGVGRA